MARFKCPCMRITSSLVLTILAIEAVLPLVSAFSTWQPQQQQQQPACVLSATLVPTDSNASPFSFADDNDDDDHLPPTPLVRNLQVQFPHFSTALENMKISTPTPIQQSSASRALNGENLLLVAPTGSGKTLAYILPALTTAMEEDGTILVVAPTRELAVQLLRDTMDLLEDEQAKEGVRLAVKGVDPPILNDDSATILIGTPTELYESLMYGGSSAFLSDLSAIILDEVDVLLPPTPKTLRTALDKNHHKTARQERRQMEQKRKIQAAKRRGAQMDDDTGRILTDTEKCLDLVANSRLENTPLLMAGSATASRKALDRLNQALRYVSREAAVPLGMNVQICRPAENNDNDDAVSTSDVSPKPHTIRAVTVPKQVEHRYMQLTKEASSDPHQVLSAVAEAASMLQPETSLLFLCGEFGKQTKAKKTSAPPKEFRGATSQARRNAKRKAAARGLYAKAAAKGKTTKEAPTLSARKACKLLGKMGIVAQPLHVALGLEEDMSTNTQQQDDEDEIPPFLVTFEGSARGLHLDGVDAVFVVGRPSSAASYLHLAGRVGRASGADENGNIVTKGGTVVSICTKGSAVELQKWTQQIGGLQLQELVVGSESD